MTPNEINKIKLDFIDHYGGPIRIIDDNNIIVYLNNSMINLFGNLLGEPADIICVNGFGIKNSGQGDKSEKERQAQVYIGEALYLIRSFIIRDHDGKKYIVEIFRDITEQKRTEAQFKNNYNKLLSETQFARGVQQCLLPIDDTYWNMIDFRSEYLPTEDLGGDMFDIIQLSDHEVLMYMADVSGHGIKAALLTIYLRQEMRAMPNIAKDEGLDKLLEVLLNDFSKLDIDSEIYFSIIICKYNSQTQELSLVNAGHNCFPMILREKGRIEEIPLKGMPVTKIGFTNRYDEEIIGIYPGDRVILYTDGIIEEYNDVLGTEFGVQGIRNVVSANFGLSGEDLSRKIVHEAEKHSKTRAKDDRSIFVATIL